MNTLFFTQSTTVLANNSEDITLDFTNAVDMVEVILFTDGASEPTIIDSATKIRAAAGSHRLGRVNQYRFKYFQGKCSLDIVYDMKTAVSSPQTSFSLTSENAGDLTITPPSEGADSYNVYINTVDDINTATLLANTNNTILTIDNLDYEQQYFVFTNAEKLGFNDSLYSVVSFTTSQDPGGTPQGFTDLFTGTTIDVRWNVLEGSQVSVSQNDGLFLTDLVTGDLPSTTLAKVDTKNNYQLDTLDQTVEFTIDQNDSNELHFASFGLFDSTSDNFVRLRAKGEQGQVIFDGRLNGATAFNETLFFPLEGEFRLVFSSGNIDFQKKEGGNWISKQVKSFVANNLFLEIKRNRLSTQGNIFKFSKVAVNV